VKIGSHRGNYSAVFLVEPFTPAQELLNSTAFFSSRVHTVLCARDDL